MTRPRNSHAAHQLLRHTLTDLEHITSTIHPTGRPRTTRLHLAWQLSADHTYGPASPNLDPTTTGTGTSTRLTPVEAAATRHAGRNHRAELAEAIHQLEQAARHARRVIDQYTNAPETQQARATRPTVDLGSDDACALHALIDTWAPADRTSTCGGNLTTPTRVCKACHDRIRRTGNTPSKADLRHHHTTGRWPKLRAPTERPPTP